MGKYVLSSKQMTSKSCVGAQPCCELWGVADHVGPTGRHRSEHSQDALKGGGFSHSAEQWNNLITQRPLGTT